jgi:hypothetical protein
MTQESEIQQLREEVLELRLLYKKLAESMIPTVKPTPEELESLKDDSDDCISEAEFMKILGSKRRRSKRSASA